jgi:hypothetical protein
MIGETWLLLNVQIFKLFRFQAFLLSSPLRAYFRPKPPTQNKKFPWVFASKRETKELFLKRKRKKNYGFLNKF